MSMSIESAFLSITSRDPFEKDCAALQPCQVFSFETHEFVYFKSCNNTAAVSIACYTFSNFFQSPFNCISKLLWNFYHIKVCQDEVNVNLGVSVAFKVQELVSLLGISSENIEDLQKRNKLEETILDCVSRKIERESFLEILNQASSEDQYSYALMCYNGDGKEPDLKEARAYFKLAADRGHEDAQLLYALMCHYQEGGDLDLEEAKFYIKLAIDSGSKDAQRFFDLLPSSSL
jgi:TPR repeat protein